MPSRCTHREPSPTRGSSACSIPTSRGDRMAIEIYDQPDFIDSYAEITRQSQALLPEVGFQ